MLTMAQSPEMPSGLLRNLAMAQPIRGPQRASHTAMTQVVGWLGFTISWGSAIAMVDGGWLIAG